MKSNPTVTESCTESGKVTPMRTVTPTATSKVGPLGNTTSIAFTTATPSAAATRAVTNGGEQGMEFGVGSLVMAIFAAMALS
jgi:hypothetical protein